MTRRTMLSITAVAILATLTLTSCDSTGQIPAPTGTDVPTTTPTEPTAGTPPQHVTLPACADAFPIDDVRVATDRPGVELLDPDEPPADAVPPTGEEAVRAATSIEYCVWGNENSGFGFTGILAELPDDAKVQLLTQLSGTIYEEYDLDGAQGFTRDSELDVQHAETQILIGNIWIVVSGYLDADHTRAVAEIGLAGVRATNSNL